MACDSGGSDNAETEFLPVAIDDTATLLENSPEINILTISNDTFTADLDLNTLEIITPSQNGEATVSSSEEILYLLDANFVGTDSLQYTVKDIDGNISNPATITINVTAFAIPDAIPITGWEASAQLAKDTQEPWVRRTISANKNVPVGDGLDARNSLTSMFRWSINDGYIPPYILTKYGEIGVIITC